jgi:hypothetical protein
MCQQICIFKIELDPEIRSVYLNFFVPRTVPRAADRADPERYADSLATEEEIQRAEDKGFNVSPELAHTKKKVGSFADDLTCGKNYHYADR